MTEGEMGPVTEKEQKRKGAETTEPLWIEMKVRHMLIDPRNESPIVMLKSDDEEHSLPIWVGPYEASAIIMAINEHEFPRPLTHDLIVNVIEAFDAEIESVRVHRLDESTYFAAIVLTTEKGGKKEVDARPSDSIALAIRAGAPIYVHEEIAEPGDSIDEFIEKFQAETYKTILDNLDPDEISKYMM